MSTIPKEIDKILNRAGDVELAHVQWETFQTHFPRFDWDQKNVPFLLSLFGNCHTFLGWLSHQPTLLDDLLHSPFFSRPKSLLQMNRDIQIFLKKKNIKTALRHFRQAEYLRLIIRELSGLAPYEEIGQELAHLATVSLRAALDEVQQHFGKSELELAVIGLGKLGGEDLNFSSDVDLLFLYETKAGNSLSHHERTTQLFTKLMELIEDKTEEGFVFRVDTNLRPEGKKGPLVNSLNAAEDYYEAWGSNWERCALIKTRPIAGSTLLGNSFVKKINPFVYRQSLDTSAISDIREMKQKINTEEKKRFRKSFNVKLGEGGIREIEFFVAVFQLFYGGKKWELQQTNTLRALQGLVKLRLIKRQTAIELQDAYIFLRRIENRLQFLDDQQVHHLPDGKLELLAVARRMGYPSSDQFLTDLQVHTRRVKDHFEGLVPHGFK